MSETPPFEPTVPPTEPGPELLPWEAPNAGVGSIVPTLGRFLTSPSDAFARMSPSVDLVRPIAYFVAFVLAAAVLAQLWNFLLWDSLIGAVKAFVPPQMQSMLQRPGGLQIALSLIITPLVYLILLFIWSGVVHLILAMLGGAAGGFSMTLRVVCYARSSDVATVVPVFGGLVAWVWRRVLEIIGLSTAHKTEGWKAAIAVLLPVLLCCLCIIGGAMAFGAAIAQAFQQVK